MLPKSPGLILRPRGIYYCFINITFFLVVLDQLFYFLQVQETQWKHPPAPKPTYSLKPGLPDHPPPPAQATPHGAARRDVRWRDRDDTDSAAEWRQRDRPRVAIATAGRCPSGVGSPPSGMRRATQHLPRSRASPRLRTSGFPGTAVGRPRNSRKVTTTVMRRPPLSQSGAPAARLGPGPAPRCDVYSARAPRPGCACVVAPAGHRPPLADAGGVRRAGPGAGAAEW
jgi:hypothetical protein